MKAFILRGPRKLERVEMPVPEPGPYQVRIKVAYVGICGSDVEAYLGHRKVEYLGDPPMPGHEPSGVIDAVGRHVTGLKAGDRVTAVNEWGCFADHIVTAVENVLKLSPEISLPDGSRIEALPAVISAVVKTGITTAHDVLVLGTGLSGLQLVRMVALNGCKRLIAVDLFDEKLAIAREFGATHTINARTENVVARVNEIVPGGADVTILATLDGNDLVQAIELTRPRGKVVLYGSIGPCDRIDLFELHAKAISVVKETNECYGVLEKRRLWREAMQLVADGVLCIERLRTHVLPMEKLPEAMEMRSTPRADVIHVLMRNDWAGDCE